MNTSFDDELNQLHDDMQELLQYWVDYPEEFEESRDSELDLLVSLNAQYDELSKKADEESAETWLGPRWYQIAIGWTLPESQAEKQKAIELKNQFDQLPKKKGECTKNRILRFTQLKLHGR